MNGNKNTGTQEHKDLREEQSPPAALTANAKGVAAMLGVSVRQVHRLHTTGRLPKNIHLGHCVRWRIQDILDYVDMGCPNRETFEANEKTL